MHESYMMYQQEEKEKQKQESASGSQKLQLTEEFPFSSSAMTTENGPTSNCPSVYDDDETIKYE